MKKLLFLLITFIPAYLMAQKNDCGTKTTSKPIIFTQAQKDKLANAINTPYTLKIFVTVFANDDGWGRAATDENILRHVQNMANQYQPHNICFILGGIRQINNTDLNSHNPDDSTENTELTPYLVSGFFNIFIHGTLVNYNGMAYDIPNTYVSISGGVIAGFENIATLGHEVGHGLGLYHTFHSWTEKNGTVHKENVDRTGNCKNCETKGDLLCDTPADDNGGVNASCLYTGTGKDACNTSYSPLTNNMMAYGNYSCRNTFTSEQGERMRSFLETNSALHAFLVHDILYTPVISNYTISSGTGYTFARDIVYVSDGNPNMTVNGTANYQFQAKKVLIKSGTKFSPASGGKVSVKSNPYCN